MSDLLAARTQMAVSLAFHIVFAAIGMAMPWLMAISHGFWLKTGSPIDRDLTRAWSRGVAIFFAVGAVSGTVLSFELGLLWPEFMRVAGPIIGMPFSWEGTAFFLEAIALGVFLYGWNRVPRWIHWASGVLVGISGVFSALFVVCANGWMNCPTGFEWVGGHALHVNPYLAMFNPAALPEGVHMVIAAFEATGFAVAAIHASALLRSPQSQWHRRAYRIALAVGAAAAIAQPVVGDRLAKGTAIRQPEKLAAMEALFQTRQPAPLLVGGLPSTETRTVKYGIEIPRLLSVLAFGNLKAEVRGLDAFDRRDWPPVVPVHLAFQIMIGAGTLLAILGLCALLSLWRRAELIHRRGFLRLVQWAGVLGFIALEAGWVVTEVGRQPWIIYGVMRTAQGVTPMPGIVYPMLIFTTLYLFLAFVVAWLLARQVRHAGY